MAGHGPTSTVPLPASEMACLSASDKGRLAVPRGLAAGTAVAGLHLAAIRHHSPACAAAVSAMIRAVRPSIVLIEGPVDFDFHLDALLDPETVPPVAIASLVDGIGGDEGGDETRVAGYYPFCAHSPEYVALMEGRAVGARLGFIDQPSGLRMVREACGADTAKPVTLQDETPFDAGDFVASLARRLACRDGHEVWDHLFESRLRDPDWAGFLADTASYCAALRAATPEDRISADGDAAREAHMAALIGQALDEVPTGGGPVVAVVGGFHAVAIMASLAGDGRIAAPETALPMGVSAKSYLVRYGFAELDALNGYGAGLAMPGWYHAIWEGRDRDADVAQDLMARFAERMRIEGRLLPVPAQVEALRIARSLAAMRGRHRVDPGPASGQETTPSVLRHDLLDGVRAALVKGEARLSEPWGERLAEFLRGDALGQVSHRAGLPPLVADARARAAAHRFTVDDGARRTRRLDLRRKPAHLAASRFAHAMALLDSGFARRTAGPDFTTGTRTDLLFEEWDYAWSPQVEARLIACATFGDRVPAACLGRLAQLRAEDETEGRGCDLEAGVARLAAGIMAGLGPQLATVSAWLADDLLEHPDFTAVARAMAALHAMETTLGPLKPPPYARLPFLCDAAYRRLVYLADDLEHTPEDAVPACLEALRLLLETLQADRDGVFDQEPLEGALMRVAQSRAPPRLLGGLLAVAVVWGLRSPAQLAEALNGRLAGAVLDLSERIALLVGILETVPGLLWQTDGVLAVVDRFLLALEEDDFVALLPHLRLAFAQLNPRETDRLAGMLAARHGLSAGAIEAGALTPNPAVIAVGRAVERRLTDSLVADGLDAWCRDEAQEVGSSEG